MTPQTLFESVLRQCAATPEFVAEFDRLTGSNLSRKGSPINIMVDDASGKTDADAGKFVEFVREFVFAPWMMTMLTQMGDNR